MARFVVSVLAWVSFALTSPALAVPTFDLIVPTEISLTGIGGGSSGFTNNGGLWIVATTDTLTAEHFLDVGVSIAVDDMRIDAVGDFLNESHWTALVPGQAVAETTRDNDYSSFLRPGESIVYSNPFVWMLDFPAFSEVLGDHVMSWSIRVGDQHVRFDTALHLADGTVFGLEFEGQRVTSVSVPEPATLLLLGAGLAGLGGMAWRRRKTRGESQNRNLPRL